jgi:hypothetical protein
MTHARALQIDIGPGIMRVATAAPDEKDAGAASSIAEDDSASRFSEDP